MSQFGAKAAEFADAGVQLFGVSSDTPFAHDVWSKQLGLSYGLLSDYNWEAAKAFDIYVDNGADLIDGLADYSPANNRGTFLIDTDGTLRHAWRAPDPSHLATPQPLLDAIGSL